MPNNRRIVLSSRPQGRASVDNFALQTVPTPALAAGQVLVRNHWLSLDPYMRGRMNEGRSYAAPQPLDETMQGQTVGQVVKSRNPDWPVGADVIGYHGWQEYGVSDGGGLRRIDTRSVPAQAWLGSVGMPGVTAWYGLNRIIEPKAGQTVAVSAASGAVGMIVGQLAKRAGCRAVGIAGGPEKCRFLTEELGFDAAIDYRQGELAKALRAACPDGIDGHFENVGGRILDAVLPQMVAHGRVALCGLIAGYNAEPIPISNPSWLLISRLKLQGFIISEHMEIWPQALAELAAGVGSGAIRYRESVTEGLENAPKAFIDLLEGRNFGKQLVHIA